MGVVPARVALPDAVLAAEYFATDVVIERMPGLVRLVFQSGAAAVSVVMPESSYERIAAAIAMGIPAVLH